MKKENEKKGLFERLIGSNKEKKSSCCGNFRIEEIPEESANDDKSKIISKPKNNCCNK